MIRALLYILDALKIASARFFECSTAGLKLHLNYMMQRNNCGNLALLLRLLQSWKVTVVFLSYNRARISRSAVLPCRVPAGMDIVPTPLFGNALVDPF
jgi:hypothetical protein